MQNNGTICDQLKLNEQNVLTFVRMPCPVRLPTETWRPECNVKNWFEDTAGYSSFHPHKTQVMKKTANIYKTKGLGKQA